MRNLAELFASLTLPQSRTGAATFAAIPVPGLPRAWVGASATDEPTLLLAVDGLAAGPPTGPALQLKYLQVQHAVPCTVLLPSGQQHEQRLTILRCLSADPLLHAYFWRVTSALLDTLGNAPSRADLDRAFAKLVELFRVLSLPPRKTIQGLWAELLLIATATDPTTLISAWHCQATDVYDFNAGGQRIEVKSASGSGRFHHFSLRQLSPPAGTAVVVASLLIERAGAGVSIDDLVTTITTRIGDRADQVMRVAEVTAATLGSAWPTGWDERFDRERAAATLAFFPYEVVPCVDRRLPPGVSDVRFVADLASCEPASLAALRRAGGLIAAAVPR